SLVWCNDHRILPQTWLEGLLFTYGNATGRPAILFDQFSMRGWWYYFPVAMAVKTPLATLVALIFSVGFWIVHRAKLWGRWWDILALAFFPCVYMIMAMRSDLDLGLRHVLPVYPFLFLFLGISVEQIRRWNRKIGNRVIAIFLCGLAVETYMA